MANSGVFEIIFRISRFAVRLSIRRQTTSSNLKFFSPREAKILQALTARMIEVDHPNAPKVEELDIPGVIDAFVADLSADLQTQLRQALHLFQWSPLLFIGKPRLFTQLSPPDGEAYIRTWAESRFGLRRQIFRGLRDLAFLGYYSQTESQRFVGHRNGDEGNGDDNPGT